MHNSSSESHFRYCICKQPLCLSFVSYHAYRISVSRATHAPFCFLTTPCGPLHKCHMSCTIQLILYIFVEFSVVDACLLLRVLRSEFSELSCGLLGLINVTEHFLKAMDICTAWQQVVVFGVVMKGSCLLRNSCYKMLISLLLWAWLCAEIANSSRRLRSLIPNCCEFIFIQLWTLHKPDECATGMEAEWQREREKWG